MDEFMAAAIAEAQCGLTEGGIPVAHAEIDCWRHAGRISSYEDTILYSTLMPCYLCAGAVVQFGIPKVVAGESATFPGARQWMESHSIEVVDLDLEECKQLMRQLIRHFPQLGNEDIGK